MVHLYDENKKNTLKLIRFVRHMKKYFLYNLIGIIGFSLFFDRLMEKLCLIRDHILNDTLGY